MKEKKLKLKITERCNANCLCCQQRLERYKEKNSNVDLDMSMELAQKSIDEAAKLGFSKVIISGGEPTLHPRLFDIIAYASERKMVTSLYTNGSLLSKEYVRKLEKVGLDNMMISFYSLDKMKFTNIRQSNFLYDAAVKGLENVSELKREGLKIEIRLQMVLMKENYQEITGLFDYGIKAGFDTLSVSYLEHATNNLELYMKSEHIQDFKENIIPKLLQINKSNVNTYENKKQNVGTIENVFRESAENTVIKYAKGEYRTDKIECKNAFQYLIVGPRGDVLPCCGSEYYSESPYISNVNEESIEEIFRGDTYREYWTKKKRMCINCATEKHFFLYLQ